MFFPVRFYYTITLIQFSYPLLADLEVDYEHLLALFLSSAMSFLCGCLSSVHCASVLKEVVHDWFHLANVLLLCYMYIDIKHIYCKLYFKEIRRYKKRRAEKVRKTQNCPPYIAPEKHHDKPRVICLLIMFKVTMNKL